MTAVSRATTFASLRKYRNYRLYLGGQAVSTIGTWMQDTTLPWLVLQRIGYRQLMYWIVLKALGAAALGPLVGWGKLERKSTVAAVALGAKARP